MLILRRLRGQCILVGDDIVVEPRLADAYFCSAIIRQGAVVKHIELERDIRFELMPRVYMTYTGFDNNGIGIGFEAPKAIRIMREELLAQSKAGAA